MAAHQVIATCFSTLWYQHIELAHLQHTEERKHAQLRLQSVSKYLSAPSNITWTGQNLLKWRVKKLACTHTALRKAAEMDKEEHCWCAVCNPN